MSNEEIQNVACFVISTLLQRCCSFEFNELSIGIAGEFDDGYRAEDLCSIPDLVGGAMSDMIDAIPTGSIPKIGNLFTPTFGRRSTKATILAAWFANQNVPLKKLFCLVRPDAENQIRVSFGTPDVQLGGQYTGRIWVPPDNGWERNWRSE